MLIQLPLSEAMDWFRQLPSKRQIASLSPDYVVADAERDPSLSPLFLGYQEGDAFWLHGVHQGKILDTGCWDFQSPYGYGGPVTNCDDHSFLCRAWSAYTEWCKHNNILVEFVRLHPLASGWQPYLGEIRDDRQTVVIPLGINDITANYSMRCLRSIKKAMSAEPEIALLPNREIQNAFPVFYRQGMAALGADAFYLFSDKYFDALAGLNNAQLMVARVGGEWLSAAIFLNGADTVEYHLGVSSPMGKRVSMSTLIHHKIACLGKARGASSYYLGGGTDRTKDNPLLTFKSGFSSVRSSFRYGFCIYRPELYKSLKHAYLNSGGKSDRVLFYR